MKNTVYLFRCYRVSMLGNMFNQTDHSTHTKIIQQYFPISESELSSNLRTQKEKKDTKFHHKIVSNTQLSQTNF